MIEQWRKAMPEKMLKLADELPEKLGGEIVYTRLELFEQLYVLHGYIRFWGGVCVNLEILYFPLGDTASVKAYVKFTPVAQTTTVTMSELLRKC